MANFFGVTADEQVPIILIGDRISDPLRSPGMGNIRKGILLRLALGNAPVEDAFDTAVPSFLAGIADWRRRNIGLVEPPGPGL